MTVPETDAKMPERTNRGMKILSSYGMTEAAFGQKIRIFQKVLRKRGVSATVPVTGVLLEHHPDLVRKHKRNIEYALYGHTYQNYSHLQYDTISKHFIRSKDIFARYDLKPHGFRSPCLLWNDRILDALIKFGFAYESNDAILWDNVVKVNKARRKILKTLCAYRSAKAVISVPKIEKGIVKIPASLPSDEMLLDLWNIADAGTLGRVLVAMMSASYERGDMQNFEFHMENFPAMEAPLGRLLDYARKKTPAVWIETLENISKWWLERSKYHFEIKERKEGYELVSDCPRHATILIRGAGTDVKQEDWFGRYKTVNKNRFFIKSMRIPCIGVVPGTPKSLIEFLRTEGFIVDESTGGRRFAIYIEDIYKFDRNAGDEIRILGRIESANAPLVRLWRWPLNARSALAITSEIEAVTLWDFLKRKKDKNPA